jgi:2-keto-4-pentenoate hydratase
MVEAAPGETAFPDGASGAARFLFESTARRGISLEPGQWISGAGVTGVHRAHPGQIVQACFNGGLPPGRGGA